MTQLTIMLQLYLLISLFLLMPVIWTLRSGGNDFSSPSQSCDSCRQLKRQRGDNMSDRSSTYESWTAHTSYNKLPAANSRFFTSHIPFHSNHTHMKNYVHGHYTALRNPRLTFSVLQPAGQGCDGNSTATVKDTSKTRRCIVAQNGGFYVSRTGACLGNIVSDGRLIRNSHGVQNAHFGITRNGTIIVGYLSEKDVKTLDFQQLVGGVIWMIRNGASYIDEAVQLEEESTQETGTLRYFADVQTGRSAIGHVSNGQVVFVQVDGRTGETGVNLEAFAKYLIDEFHLVNAINLDGGGSATVAINDTLASYPSNYCKNTPKWWCPRPVSTVICAHSPDCEPACENGQCVDGRRMLLRFWLAW
ncbi:N-acetylglucosamine-1-phosphodiester alpha-N-acetylglucosaminidase-like isoform X2 [Clavelina lepadiformis]|uniref:N-acetylglucosamine-1-phosphodiester alpha-N-acetylglucosaminidase-like isoform X2 n=1 Tax=Clavelina lepadiformis TaxID=159417 RepID=UPI0040436281